MNYPNLIYAILVYLALSSYQPVIENKTTSTITKTIASATSAGTQSLTQISTKTQKVLPYLAQTQTITPSTSNTATPKIPFLVFELLRPGEIVKHPATDSNPYVFFSLFPESLLSEDHVPILVWPHGGADVSEDYSYHESMARSVIDELDGYANDYRVVIIVAAIPRSTRGWAHSLHPSVFSNPDPFLDRPDLKLIDIVWNQYIPLLGEAGYSTDHRVYMMGFSSSAMFSQRFSILHPELVKAVWLGAAGIATLPTSELDGKLLDFPLGVRNLEVLTGSPFDYDSFSTIHHFVAVGELDNRPGNDTIEMFSTADQKFLNSHFGPTNPERVVFYAKYLQSLEISANYRIYKGVGHQKVPEMFVDAFNFLFGEDAKTDIRLHTPLPDLSPPADIDWSTVAPFVIDDEGDASGHGDLDILAVRQFIDASYLYINLEIAESFDPTISGMSFDLYADGICINMTIGSHVASSTGIDIFDICGTEPSIENRLSTEGTNVSWGEMIEVRIPMRTLGNPSEIRFEYFSAFENKNWQHYDIVFP